MQEIGTGKISLEYVWWQYKGTCVIRRQVSVVRFVTIQLFNLAGCLVWRIACSLQYPSGTVFSCAYGLYVGSRISVYVWC